MKFSATVKATLVFGALCITTPAYADSTATWAGVDVTDDSSFVYLGGFHALNGDLDLDGYLIRASVGYGDFDYNTVAVTGLGVDGDAFAADLMGGYQHYFWDNTFRFSGFVGIDYQNVDVSPNDPGNTATGSETGVKGLLDLTAMLSENVDMNANVSYSTAFETYYGSATVGYDFGPLTLGPEITFLGNEEYDQQRFGARVSDINVGNVFGLSLNAGHAEGSGTADDSFYAGLTIDRSF